MICKYTFLNIGKGEWQKTGPGFFLDIVSILLLIFENGISKKLD